MSEPRLTPAEDQVARLVAHGYDYPRIAITLAVSPRTIAVHVHRIAAKLPNPDGLKPYTLVLLWAAHQRWLTEREASAA